MAIDRISRRLGSTYTATEVQRTSQLTIYDLRRQPPGLVGAFENDRSLIPLSRPRFQVQVDPKTYVEWVQDSKIPGQHQLAIDDYTIVTRVL